MREDLISKYREQFYHAIDNRVFNLILLPTEKCNFRCSYCYEDYKIGRMLDHTVAAIKALIENRAKAGWLKHLIISWFGGEPLLEKEIIYDLSLFIKTLAGLYDFVYTSNISTNGYFLNEDTVTNLFNAKVLHYQITLDGYQSIHDQTRKNVTGLGTFDTIWNNLVSMKKRKDVFSVVLRVHITPSNVDDIKTRLIPNIEEMFGNDSRFQVFFKSINKLGGKSDDFITLSEEDKDVVIDDLYSFLIRRGKVKPWYLDDDIKGPYICYAGKPNSFIIRADGSIAKCTVAFNDEKNFIGKILENGTMEIDQKKLQFWLRGLKKRDIFISGCPYHNHMPRDIKCEQPCKV